MLSENCAYNLVLDYHKVPHLVDRHFVADSPPTGATGVDRPDYWDIQVVDSLAVVGNLDVGNLAVDIHSLVVDLKKTI